MVVCKECVGVWVDEVWENCFVGCVDGCFGVFDWVVCEYFGCGVDGDDFVVECGECGVFEDDDVGFFVGVDD